MMIKALLAITLILIATDYVLTGGDYLSSFLRSTGHFFHWLTASGKNSIFSK